MDPAPSEIQRPRRRAASLVAPLVLLLAVGAPVGVLAARSPAPDPSVEAAPATTVNASPAPPDPTPARPPVRTSTAPSGPANTSAFSLEPGDCLPVEPPETASVTVVVLPCTDPHEAEVYAVFDLPGPAGVGFPGEAITTSQAAAGCELRFDAYVGLAYADSAYDYFFYKPDEKTWSALRDRAVTCILTSPPRDRSARGSQT